MLLRYVVLFLNILVAASKLTVGWSIGKAEGGPKPGGIYWITKIKLGIVDDEPELSPTRVACIVLRAKWLKLDTYHVHVAKMRKIPYREGFVGLRAPDFFELGTEISTAEGGFIEISDLLRILPLPIHELSGNREEIQLYDNNLVWMPEEAVGRLVMVSGMVNGWDAGQNGPLIGRVYWILPHYLGFKAAETGVYIPCVVIHRLFGNTYRVARIWRPMHPSRYHHWRVTEFFGDADLQTGIPIETGFNDFKSDYFDPHNKYEVKGDPKIMQKWRTGKLLKMPNIGLNRLAAAFGIVGGGWVDGWDAGHAPLSGGVYWVNARVHFETEDEPGVYIPCVLIGEVGNKYQVVTMSLPPKHQNGCLVREFFHGGADLQTGIPAPGLNDLKNYYIYPLPLLEVEKDPKILQKWKGGKSIIIPKEGLEVLRLLAA